MKKLWMIPCILIFVCLVGYYIVTYKELNQVRKSINYNYEEKKEELKSNINNIKDKIDNNLIIDINNDNDIINDINSYIEELSISIEELNIKETNLNEQKDILTKKYNNIKQEEAQKEQLRKEEELRKSTFILNNVPTINQYTQGYPTGCESAALTLLLKYWGINISMSEIVNVLPKGELPYYEGDIMYGGNPYLEFVGNPSQNNGFGVYNEPIRDVANKYKDGAISVSGKPLSEILNIVKEGRPVIVWNSMSMALPYVSKSWIYKPTDEKINWISNEHALLVVGYNNESIITSDSLCGTIKYYPRNTFESRYNYFGKRAVYY